MSHRNTPGLWTALTFLLAAGVSGCSGDSSSDVARVAPAPVDQAAGPTDPAQAKKSAPKTSALSVDQNKVSTRP
jgi:hypothetical protein